jgi:cytochrome c553
MEYLTMKQGAIKLFLLCILFLFGAQGLAAPSTNVAWTSEIRALVASGNFESGEKLAGQCASCHGATGVSSTAAYPSLAGQLATYLFKQLKDYQDDKRADNAIMTGIAGGLSEQNMVDLAAFYAAQSLPPANSENGESDVARQLVGKGDGKRLIPPCAACHGASGEGKIVHYPALAGQMSRYISQTLQNYKSGQRANDIYSRMRLIAAKLSKPEIKALADYYGSLESR